MTKRMPETCKISFCPRCWWFCLDSTNRMKDEFCANCAAECEENDLPLVKFEQVVLDQKQFLEWRFDPNKRYSSAGEWENESQ